jgi:hypothetical protein
MFSSIIVMIISFIFMLIIHLSVQEYQSAFYRKTFLLNYFDICSLKWLTSALLLNNLKVAQHLGCISLCSMIFFLKLNVQQHNFYFENCQLYVYKILLCSKLLVSLLLIKISNIFFSCSAKSFNV